MNTTHPLPPGTPTVGAPLPPPDGHPRPPRPTRGRVARIAKAIAAAFAIQVAAVLTAYVAFGIALVAAFSSWASSDPTPWWGALAVPVAICALGVYGLSGLVASRIARSHWAWATLLLLPVAAVVTTAAFAVV